VPRRAVRSSRTPAEVQRGIIESLSPGVRFIVPRGLEVARGLTVWRPGAVAGRHHLDIRVSATCRQLRPAPSVVVRSTLARDVSGGPRTRKASAVAMPKEHCAEEFACTHLHHPLWVDLMT